MENPSLSSAMEDYMEAIYLLEKENKVARVSDIGRQLNVRKASVVSAVSLLGKQELLKHEKYGFITLTEKGKELAELVYRKHVVLFEFLAGTLKIDGEKAKTEACAIEHMLSEETINKISALIKYVKKSEAAPVKKQVKKQAKKKAVKKQAKKTAKRKKSKK